MAFILTNDHSTNNYSKLKPGCGLNQSIGVVLGLWDVFKSVTLLAARRWHDELVASAAALGNLRAIAKLEILRQAQSHFG